ncbi:RHS repeat-associated core domain-containing protein [Serratia liquefaciens]|uniref:RHS repeat-associated core domain-containing protein n=1 Tax=Serratia liquefaciens TaxID=614 RepID=UPI0032DF24E7
MRLSLNTSNNMNSLLFSRNENGGGKSISYTPYGGSKKFRNLPAGFNGQRVDPVSQCYHLGNGARSYNPVLMRFNSPDRLSPFGAGGINPYAYCLGDPINRSDPSGHISVLGTTTSIIGLVLGALSIFAGGAGIATIALSLASLGTGTASVGLAISANSKIDSRPADAKNEESTAAMLGIISAVTGAAAMISAKFSAEFFKKKTVIEKYNTQSSVPRRSSVVNKATQTSASSESVAVQTSENLGSTSRSSILTPTPEVPSPLGRAQGTPIAPRPRPAGPARKTPNSDPQFTSFADEIQRMADKYYKGGFKARTTKVAKQYVIGYSDTVGKGGEFGEVNINIRAENKL